MCKEAKISQTFIATFSKENEVLQIKKKNQKHTKSYFLNGIYALNFVLLL